MTSKQVHFRVSVEEYDKLYNICKEKNIDMSTYLRNALKNSYLNDINYCEFELKKRLDDVAFLKNIITELKENIVLNEGDKGCSELSKEEFDFLQIQIRNYPDSDSLQLKFFNDKFKMGKDIDWLKSIKKKYNGGLNFV